MQFLNQLHSNRFARARNFRLEALEERVLLAGITPFPTSKAKFIDADGDKVNLKLKGGDQMVVTLLGGGSNNADIDTLTIVPGKSGIFTGDTVFSSKIKAKGGDGTTEIANFTMQDLPGVETIASLQLNGIFIANLNLPGNLNELIATNSDFGNAFIGGLLGEFTIGVRNLTGTLHANAIGRIDNTGPLSAGDIAGNIISDTFITEILTNRITGSVTAGTSITTLATVEDLDGAVEANAGTLNAVIGRNLDGSLIVNNGNINLGTLTLPRVKNDVTGIVHADGTLSLHAEGNFIAGASISSGGDMVAKANAILTDLVSTGGDITFAMKTGGLTTAVSAAGDVDGEGSILIKGGHLSGQITAGGNIADIEFDSNEFGITGSLIAGMAVGNLTPGFFSGATVTAGTTIGAITVAHSDDVGGITAAILNSSFTAGTNIGAITVAQTGGDHAIDQSSFTASGGSIGPITASTTGTGSAIRGLAPLPTFSAGSTIGAINATAVSAAAISTAHLQAGAGFGSILGTSESGDGIDASTFVSTAGGMGAISGVSISGKGIDGSTFQAASNITSINGTSETDEGINESTFRAVRGTIGDITGRSTDATSTADGISDSNFTSGSSMGHVLGTGQLGSGIAGSAFSADGDVASITGTTANTDAGTDSDGIQSSVFRSGADIGRIFASTGVEDDGLAGATESEAIDAASIFSAFGNILSGEENTIETEGDIQTSFFLAGYDIGGNLVIDGLAGPGSDDIKGDPSVPVQIGQISVGGDIVASFFAAGIGTDNAIFGDAVVGDKDDFNNAPASSIAGVTVEGVIAGGEGLTFAPRAAFSADHIGLIEADAIGISDEDNTTVASVGINAMYSLFSIGGIDGIMVETSTREQAIADGILVTTAGDVGFVTATNLSETARSAIGAGSFDGLGFIGDITASTPNSETAVAIDGRAGGITFSYTGTNPDTDLTIGNVSATGVNVAGTVAIAEASFIGGENFGSITTLGNVVDSFFGTAGDIASTDGGTGITVEGNVIDTSFSAEGSLAGNGGITVSPITGEQGYISGSSFLGGANDPVTGLAVGDIFVGGMNADGAAISDSSAFVAGVDIGSVYLRAGSLEDSTFSAGRNIALTGGIFVYGNTVHKDFGILNSTFTAAGGDLGAITVGPAGLAKNTVGAEISGSTFSATNIAVGMDGETERAIVIHGNNTGSATNRAPAEAGLSIYMSTFTAAAPDGTAGIGSIGDVLIAQSAGDLSGGGIESSSFLANLHLGSIKVKINVTDADEDVSAIGNSTFRGRSFDSETDTEFGSIADIIAIISGLPSTMDVITNSTFHSGPDLPEVGEGEMESLFSMGNITAMTDGSGAAFSGNVFRTGGEMGTITGESGSSANDAVLETIFSAFGSIGTGQGNDIGIVGNVIDSKFLAGYDIGADLDFDGFPLLSTDEAAIPGTERVSNEGEVTINRVSINGNLIASDIVAAINPGDDIFGNTAPIVLDADGNPLPPAAGDDTVPEGVDSRLGTVQVQGEIFTQGDDPKEHAIAAGFIAQFQQPTNVNRDSELPGFLDNGGGSLDVRIEGSPSGAPVFLTSRDFAGREIDFNFDGNPDVVMLDSQSNQLKIFLGDGTGGFQDPIVFTVGTAPVAAVVGNFNGDHRVDADGNMVFDGGGNPIPVLDIIVLNSLSDTRTGVNGANTIDIFLGNNVTGAFSGSVIQSLGIGSRTLTSIVASDWVDTTVANAPTGDGFLDLVITNDTDSNARLLRNNGAAVFTATSVNNPFSTGGGPTGASATPPLSAIPPESSAPGASAYNIDEGDDLNGLNGPDLVVANSDDDTISVFFGNSLGLGTGQFSAPATVGVGTTPLQTILADVDNDNDVDILVVNFGSDNVTILFNNGLGGFGASTTIALPAGAAPRAIIVGFFDGDSFIDFATANSGTNDVSVVRNTDGVFTGATSVETTLTGSPLSITSSDYDNDGDIDLAVTNADNAQAPVILQNDGLGGF